MAVTSFIPELWSARLLRNLENEHVATAFVNRDYEGEIRKMGDTVHVNFLGPITVRDYVKGTPIEGPDTLNTEDEVLEINNAKYFNFYVDDVDKVQAAGPLMDTAIGQAAYDIADVVDKAIFTAMAAADKAPLDITIKTPADAYNTLVALRTKLSEANAPRANRKVAVSPEFYGLLLKDDRFVGVGSEKADERLENGFVGRAAGFDVYETNNVPDATGNVAQIVAAVPIGTSFAEQIVEIEGYRPEKAFADAVKGLNVYGVKVFRPECVKVAKYTIDEG